MNVNRGLAGAVLLAALALAAGCGESPDPNTIRLWTDEFEMRVTSDVTPPRALERITYKVIVLDKKTQEPIADGEGRIFATNADRKSVWNGFTYGPEVGTYRATLMFVTAGDWALGIQFRRDSTLALQRTTDWRQTVRNELVPTGDTAGAMSLPAATPVPDSVADKVRDAARDTTRDTTPAAPPKKTP